MQKSDDNERRKTAFEENAAAGNAAGKTRKSARAAKAGASQAWYAGPYKDALLYLMVAIFLVEMVVGGVAFFYGVVHAVPETPGGPPLARFPWLGWAVAAVLVPVGLILVVHLAGTWVSRFLGRESGEAAGGGPGAPSGPDEQGGPDDAGEVPERLRRFYAIIRNAPTVALLLGIMLLGAGLFFVDGAFSALVRLGGALTQYVPWMAGSAAALVAVCYLVHRWFVYRQRRMEREYEYRRQVLERTGIVLVDKHCIPLPQTEEQRLALGEARVTDVNAALPPVLDVEGQVPPARGGGSEEGAAEDVTDAEIVSPEQPKEEGSRPRAEG